MRTLANPICPFSFVGKRVPIDPSRGLNSLFHKDNGDGTQTLPPPPYAITEDTTILDGIFRQAVPHTAVFAVSPGVKFVIRGDGDYCNASLPDEAEVVGFPNLSHGVEVATGNEERPTVRLLCECEKCVTAQAELDALRGKSLAEEQALGTRDAEGRRVHAKPTGACLKARFRERRKDALKVAADRTKAAAGNLAALRKVNPAGTLRADITASLKRGV